MTTASSNPGYQMPDDASPAPAKGKGKGKDAASTIAAAKTVLKHAPDTTAAALAAGARTVEPQQQRQNHAINRPVVRNFADEVDSREDADSAEDVVVDMMAPNENQLFMMESINEGFFREFVAGEPITIGIEGDGKPVIKFEGQIAYEAFMQEPVVIRIHSTKDKNEARLVYVGVNGDSRWLERDKNYRVPRKFVERLLQAQEMAYRTIENGDPTVDNAMKLLKSLAASYEFSVMRDENPVGRRWMRRMKREGS